jgi:hypothetical protein
VGVFLVGLMAGAWSCGGGSSSPGSEFCQSWATGFCQKLYDCTPADQRGADFLGGPSQSTCVQGWAATCSNPQNGQSFDVNCSNGAHVNTAAKSLCLNELSTITCDQFNSPDYMSVCTQVCGSSQTGTGGTGVGGAGTGGTGATGTGGTGTGGTGTGGTGTGGSGATACGTVEPCGGNLVGTWALTSECLDAGELNTSIQQGLYCPQALVTASGVNISGTATFTSGLTYTLAENLSYMLTISMPSTCTNGLTCADYGIYQAAYLPPGTTFSCTGTTTCTCTESTTKSGSDTGTYVLSGSNATLTSTTTGTTSTNGYCVQGSTIHLITVDTTMHTGPNNQATIATDIVAQKQ